MNQDKDRYEDQDDAILVACVLAGTREAFDILLARYSSSVLRLCTALLGNTVEAQDIAQEASLQAFLGLSRLQEPSCFTAWFHAIAANLARSALRRRRELSLDTLGDETMTQTFWTNTPLEEYLTERELHETILLALQDLSLVNRQAVIGFYLEGYSYEELAHILGIPVSTVKGRLFQGRQQLKTRLQPLAEALLYPLDKRRKEQHMTTSDLVELQINSVNLLLLTQQHVAILRDPHTQRGFAIRLTPAEADALAIAFGARAHKPFLQDLSQRLLESLGAQLQRVMINALAGQTLYATLTIAQGSQTREIDLRLSEALTLATRVGAPIFITRSLFETAATLDLTSQASKSSWQELETRRDAAQNLGREQRLQLEEDIRGGMAPRGNIRPPRFAERLWAWLLEALTGTQNGISAAELRALDVATTFPTREVTWDGLPMIAIGVPDHTELPQHREMAWIIVQPEVWERITRMLQHLRAPEHNGECAQAVADPFPHGLPPQIQQRVEASFARLLEEPELRTALLHNPQGTVMVWKGVDTPDTLQRFTSTHRKQHLANEGDLERQLGHQPQIGALAFNDKKVPGQDLPADAHGVMAAKVHPSGWVMMVFFVGKDARGPKEKTHQRLHQITQELTDILHA